MERTAELLRAKRIGVVVAYTALLVLSAVIIRQDHLRHTGTVREHVSEDIAALANELEDKFFTLEVFADRLAAVAGVSGDVPVALLERTSQDLLQRYPEISTVAIAPDMIITHVAPLDGNEQALGLNYREIPAQLAAASKAVRERSATLSGPTDLVQGGRGYILLHPVFAAQGSADSGRLWGLISIVIPESELLHSHRGEDGHGYGGHLDVAVRSLLPGGKILGQADVFERDPVVNTSEFLNGAWQVAGVPSDGWPDVSPRLLPLLAALLVMGGVLSVVLLWIQRLSRQRERALKLLTNAVDALDAGFVLYDEDDRLIICNDRFAAPFNLTKASMRPGTRYSSLLRLTAPYRQPEDMDQTEDEWLQQRLRDHEAGQEYVVRQPDRAWVKVSETRTTDGFSVSVVSDISEQKEAQIAAEAADREKTEFLSNVTHELRTPLTVINGFAQLLTADGLLPERCRFRKALADPAPELPKVRETGASFDTAVSRFGEKIAGSAQHMLTMVNDLLDWAEVERGGLHLDTRDVPLRSMVDDVLEDLRSQAEAKGLRLAADCSDHLIHADPKRLRQVLYNLVGNAIKFTDSGSVLAGARVIEDAAVFVVEDTGCGIAEEHIERVFERFHQVDNSSTRSYGGFGLGLAIASEIVSAHDGSLWAKSTPEQGSRFFFTIPQGRAASAAA